MALFFSLVGCEIRLNPIHAVHFNPMPLPESLGSVRTCLKQKLFFCGWWSSCSVETPTKRETVFRKSKPQYSARILDWCTFENHPYHAANMLCYHPCIWWPCMTPSNHLKPYLLFACICWPGATLANVGQHWHTQGPTDARCLLYKGSTRQTTCGFKQHIVRSVLSWASRSVTASVRCGCTW